MKQMILLILTLMIVGIPLHSFALDESDLQTWTVTVTHISDGDTIDVRFQDDTEDRIRLLGIQAMEVHEDVPNDCHADEATQRLIELTGGVGSEVILKVWDESVYNTYTGTPRAWRYLFVDDGNGSEINVGLKMVEEGLVLAFPHTTETLYNDDFMIAQQNAAANKINLWNDSYCSDGPSQEAQLEMWVNWDAEGDDYENVNGEWIKIKNNGGGDVSLSQWLLRDSALNYFYFPVGTTLSSGNTITVYLGSGSDSGNTLYWGLSEPLFKNEIGNGAYLLDPAPDGDIRASFTYPCIVNCTDPLEGKIELIANYDAAGDDAIADPNGEWIEIKNISAETIDLEKYMLHALPIGSHIFYFNDGNSTIAPNEIMRIYVGQGTNTALVKYWGKDNCILSNTEDKIWVDTFTGIEIADFSWPCVENCTDFLQGKIDLSANYDAAGDDTTNPNGEWVNIDNISTDTIDLKNYILKSLPTGSHLFYFDDGASTIPPNETMRIYIGNGTNTALTKYWGESSGILSNGEDMVWIDTYDGILVACYGWPETCEKPPPFQEPEPEATPSAITFAPLLQLLLK